jgi:hypothetical protein
MLLSPGGRIWTSPATIANVMKRVVVVAAVGVVVVGGLTAAGKWRDGRVAECGKRSAGLATVDLLKSSPDGFRGDAPTSECDEDRVVAYASRQFMVVGGPGVDQLAGRVAATVDQSAVTAFYRRLLESSQWQISTRKPAPGPNAATLCATKRLDFGQAHVTLAFPATGMYEVAVSDSADAGARCV